MVRHYIVRMDLIADVWRQNHADVIVDRPTPWKIFLTGFVEPTKYGFVVARNGQLERFISGDYAASFDGRILRSNGDKMEVQKWSVLNVLKFCVEGIQYKTFLKFWKWTWSKQK